MLRYKCLVLDHDDTVVQTERTIGYPYFRDYIEKIRPGCTLSFGEYVRDCNNMVFADMCVQRWQMTETEMHNEYLGWKAYSRVNIPEVCPGIERVIRRHKEAGGILCVSSLSTREIIEGIFCTTLGCSPTPSTTMTCRPISGSPILMGWSRSWSSLDYTRKKF